jgi:hypothetical protein
VPLCDCDQPAFFARRTAKLNNDGTFSGHAAVNDPLGRLQVGKNVFMPDGSSLTANYVQVGNASNVSQVFANVVKTGLGAVIRNGGGSATLPLVDPFCEIPSFTCGTQLVNLPPGSTATLTPGVYGFVRVANGATLQLAGGVYTFCDVKMGREAAIEAQGPVLMQISGSLRIGTDSYFGPTFGAPPIAAYVAGRKVRVSQSAVAVAQITAPFAKAQFGRDATLTGCFCSDQVRTDKHITLTCGP